MPPRKHLINEIIHGVLAGNQRALAKAISLVESEDSTSEELLRNLADALGTEVADAPGKHRVIGVTGPPGAGKSTLIGEAVSLLRTRGERVAILAFDPSSPYSGGALLGDRLRISSREHDDGVFLRSLSSKGQMGGLAPSAYEILAILAAANFDTIIIETVGVGQSEIGILGLADLTVVVVTPGMGDTIQALKAGVLEIADIFVINKADYDGVETLAQALHPNRIHHARSAHTAPIVPTIATTGSGIPDLIECLDSVQRQLEESGQLDERRRKRGERCVADIAVPIVHRWLSNKSIRVSPYELGKLRRNLREILDAHDLGEESD